MRKREEDGEKEGGRDKERSENERGNGPNESMNGASERSPKSIPVSLKNRDPGGVVAGPTAGLAEGDVAGVGFVRPRQRSRGQSPRRYHHSQLLLGILTLRTGRLVNPILVHSPARRRLSVAPVPSVHSRSPSASLTHRLGTLAHPLHRRYTRVSRVIVASPANATFSRLLDGRTQRYRK